MVVRFDRRADRHGVPRRSAWYVVLTKPGTPFTTNWGEAGIWYVGGDDRGIELEVGTVARGVDEVVIHAMPTSYRHTKDGE